MAGAPDMEPVLESGGEGVVEQETPHARFLVLALSLA